MARFNFNNITLSSSADITKVNENFNKIESNAVLKTDTATTSANGLMTSAMVTKLNGIATGANKTTVDSALSSTSTNPLQNKVINTELDKKVEKEDGKGLSTNDYTTAEKTKLAGIATGANKTVVDNGLNINSSNPVRNSIVTEELNKRVEKVEGKGLSTNDYTDADKEKLDGIDMSEKVNKSGDTMTGNLNIGTSSNGMTSIKLKGNTTSGLNCTISSGLGSISAGNGCQVINTSSIDSGFALGTGCVANSNTLVGIALGYHTIANSGQLSIGQYNTDTTQDNGMFVIGGASSESARQNIFRVSKSGDTYAKSSYHSSGADYAETTEWLDGNVNDEDRVGKFVCMQGTKMRIANSEDIRNRIGVVSATPAINGDSYSENWKGKYETDIFGRVLTHEVNGKLEPIISKDFDPNKEYIEREKRKEFDYFGMLGKLVVIDDGTCVVDGYCYPNDNGIATKENDVNKGFYVMERLDENHIRILLK